MVAYESSIFTIIGVALLLSMIFLVRMCIRKIRRRKLEEDFSMTSLDARHSYQFLTDFPQSNRTLQTTSFEVPAPIKNTKVSEISSPTKIVTAVSPIPSKICVTSPKGERRKSIWEMELPNIDIEHVPSRGQRETIGRSASFSSANRRDAFAMLSDKSVMAELKSLKKKEKKKRWKKIVNQKMQS
ncbi:uncharacterized protein LOC110243395 [Exaiptasia diaphana]|uniref:Uncharacterized protein n=1 Tax=Exaiptasia diaphana TaxID=2652724 RepID=A0A913XJ71_EXADI|nr:uncharacterized protein LOC110243395 [Exaiptasia diaphana]